MCQRPQHVIILMAHIDKLLKHGRQIISNQTNKKIKTVLLTCYNWPPLLVLLRCYDSQRDNNHKYYPWQ